MAYPDLLASIDTLYGSDMLRDVAAASQLVKQVAIKTARFKQSILATTYETPAGWNGGVQMPPVDNGGCLSTGKEAWDIAHVGKRRTGAHKGRIEDMQPGGRSILDKEAAKKTDVKNKKVKVVEMSEVNAGNQADLLHDLSSDERQVLMKERIVVHDNRDDKEVTLAYTVQTQLKLQNPDRTNIYNILVRPSKFAKCLVIFGPYDHKGRNEFVTCIDLDNKRWVNIHASRLWFESEFDDEAFGDWFKKLPDADSIPKGRTPNVILMPTGQGTCPLTVSESFEADDPTRPSSTMSISAAMLIWA